jgi:hypothetical protein
MAIMFDMPKSPSSQLKTVLRYFDLVKVLDLAEIEKLFAGDFVQSTRPLSLGVPSRTKEEDLAFLRGFAEKLEERRLEVKQNGPPYHTEQGGADRLCRTCFAYRLRCMT